MNLRCAVVLLAFAACSPSSVPVVEESSRALTADQCLYFDQAGKTVICHATTSAKNPIVKIQIGTSACVDEHSTHPRDFVAPDGNCGPDACLPADAPCDATLRCCGDFLSCGGGATPGVCGCTPRTCAEAGRACGSLDDGCGGTLDCGSCKTGQVCSSAGQCAGACDTPPNTGCGVGNTCCQTNPADQQACCPRVKMLVHRRCTGPGFCQPGSVGTYPNCDTPPECPVGSEPAPAPGGGYGCANDCGLVGPLGCSVCQPTTPWTASCTIGLVGDSCVVSIN